MKNLKYTVKGIDSSENGEKALRALLAVLPEAQDASFDTEDSSLFFSCKFQNITAYDAEMKLSGALAAVGLELILPANVSAYEYAPEKYATGEETYIVLKGLENKLVFTPDKEIRPYQMVDISYIAEDGSEYTISDIAQLDLSFDTKLAVSFTVKWSGANGAQASGEAKYKFNIIYDVPAVIELKKQ